MTDAVIPTAEIRRLDAAAAAERIDGLVEVLCDVVDGGASVSFLPPMDPALARRFWEGVIAAVDGGGRVLLVAESGAGLLGSVQLDPSATPNQRHRADVMKLLVHRRARRLGLGRRLMLVLEDEARRAGRSLLTLDTWTGSPAEALYRSLGYTLAGVIPGYALTAGGTLEPTSIMYKAL